MSCPLPSAKPLLLPEINDRANSRLSRNSARSSSASPETRQSTSRDSKTSSRSRSSARKEPAYNESALQITSSPPLTSFLNDRNSASSAQEEAYLKHASRMRIARLVLSVLTIGAAVAALGCTGDVLKHYNDTRLGKDWHLPLWPINIDLKPSLGILIPAAIVTFCNVFYIVAAVIPSPHSRTALLTRTYLLTSTLTLLLSIFSLTFSPILTYHTDPSSHPTVAGPRDTIQTFTCRLYHSAHTFNSASADIGIPIFGNGMSYPAGFKRMCLESEAGLGLMGGVAVLSLLGVGIAGWGMRGEKKIAQGRKERWGEKYDGMTKA